MKTILFFLLTTLTFSISAQSMPPGSLLGVHEMEIELAEGVTMDEYIGHFNDVMIPAYEKAFRGTKVSMIKGKRGECEDCIGMLWVFVSEGIRDQFFDKEGNMTPLFTQRNNMIQSEIDAQDKLGTVTGRTYTDWVVL